jgi:hypothetical protein
VAVVVTVGGSPEVRQPSLRICLRLLLRTMLPRRWRLQLEYCKRVNRPYTDSSPSRRYNTYRVRPSTYPSTRAHV